MPSSDSVDPRVLGAQQEEWWADSLDEAVLARDRHAEKSDQFMDVQFEEVVADPVAVLGRACERFDIPWLATIEASMRGFLANNPRGKHGAHRYELEDFGMKLGGIRQCFESYCDRYAIPPAL